MGPTGEVELTGVAYGAEEEVITPPETLGELIEAPVPVGPRVEVELGRA